MQLIIIRSIEIDRFSRASISPIHPFLSEINRNESLRVTITTTITSFHPYYVEKTRRDDVVISKSSRCPVLSCPVLSCHDSLP